MSIAKKNGYAIKVHSIRLATNHITDYQRATPWPSPPEQSYYISNLMSQMPTDYNLQQEIK